jgi:molecular chaperone HtpG
MEIGTILNDAVRQFSDPMAFYRELVQNAIDAGTGEVEITLTYDEAARRAEVEVCDAGEGMNREIIEGRLLKLFSSSKDDDLTKIGRFGIGFVSVFGIEPDHVVVETGRGGEYWRLLFDEDRTYELFALDTPREGTTVTVLKSMSREAFDAFEKRSAEVTRSWCLHAEVPIYFHGVDVREAFDIDSLVTCTAVEEGTRAVMGLTRRSRGNAAYFNRGLTLKDDAESPWPFVSYKIDSRYLEHTLTRDQVIKDDHFQKAFRLLREMATSALPDELLRRLEDSVSKDESDVHVALCQHLVRQVQFGGSLPKGWRSRPILRTIARDPVSVDDLQDVLARGQQPVFFLRRAGPLQQLFPDALFVEGRRAGPVGFLLSVVLEEIPGQLEELWLLPGELIEVCPGVSEVMQALMREHLTGPPRVLFCDLTATEELTACQLALLVREDQTRIDLSLPVTPLALSELRSGRILVIDVGRPEVSALLVHHFSEPEWTAMAIFRLLFLPHSRETVEEFERWSVTAMRMRKRRRAPIIEEEEV